MSESLSIFKFLFKKEWNVLKEVLGNQEVDEFSNASELVTCLSEDNPNLIFTAINDKSDLGQITNFIKMIKNTHHKIVMKVIVTNFSGQRQFENTIQKLGIQDIIEPQISEKAFKHKYDFWIKGLENQSKLKTSKSDVLHDNEAVKKDNKNESLLIWNEPLNIENDIWLIKNETSDCKKILGKWLIKLKGPGPYAAQWLNVPGKENQWKFDIREENRDVFLPESGDWFFIGDQRPDFIWKENLWLITGKDFKLEHVSNGKIDIKLELRDKNCVITKNSSFAKTKEMFIDESFDKEVIVKKLKENSEDKKIENENIINTHLEGESSTDKIDNKNLSGKINDDQEAIAGFLEGEIKSDTQKSDPSERAQSKFKEDDLGGHYEGDVLDNAVGENKKASRNKNLSSREGVEESDENTDEMMLKESKNKKNRRSGEFEEDLSRFDELSGKGDTEEIEKYYTNLNKGNDNQDASDPQRDTSIVKKLKDKNKKGHNHVEDMSGLDDLSGDSETEKLEKYYGRKKNTQDDLNDEQDNDQEKDKLHKRNLKERKNKSHDNKEEEGNGDLSGLSKTDKISGHYTNKKEIPTGDEIELSPEIDGKNRSEDTNQGENDAKEVTREGLISKEKRDEKKESKREKLDRFYRSKGKTENEKLLDDSVLDDELNQDRESLDATDLNIGEMPEDKSIAEDGEFLSQDKISSTSEDQNSGNEERSNVMRDVQDDENVIDYSKSDRKDSDDKNEAFGDDSIVTDDNLDDEATDNRNLNENQDKADRISKVSKATLELLARPVSEDLKKATQGAHLETLLTVEGKVYKCLFDDFFDEQFFVMTADRHWIVDQEVRIKLEFDYLGRKSEFNFSGKISDINQFYPGKFFLKINLTHYSKEELQMLLKLFHVRQEYAKIFIKLAQGF